MTQLQAVTPTALEARATSVQALFEKHKNEIAAALPKHLTADRMMRIALTEARKNPTLLQCDQASLLGAVIQAAQLGLEPGGALGHCYLIPFENRKAGRKEVQFIVGYRGMLDLVRRSGFCSQVIARAVYEGDEFSYEFGLEEKLIHKPRASASGGLSYVYAVAFMSDGRKVFDVMERREIDAIRGRSKSAESGPWVTDFEAMAKKTVIRRLFKYLPSSIEMQKAIGLDELADADVAQGNASVIGVDGAPVSGADAIKAAFASENAKHVESEAYGTSPQLEALKEAQKAPTPPVEPIIETKPAPVIIPAQKSVMESIEDIMKRNQKAAMSKAEPEVYKVPFGKKYLGKTLAEIGREGVQSYSDFLQDSAAERGEPLRGPAAEFVSHAYDFLNPDEGSFNDHTR